MIFHRPHRKPKIISKAHDNETWRVEIASEIVFIEGRKMLMVAWYDVEIYNHFMISEERPSSISPKAKNRS